MVARGRPLIAEIRLRTNPTPEWKIDESRFNAVWPPTTTNQQIFDGEIKKLLADFVGGFNVTIIGYGPSGGGKTHTLVGPLEDPQSDPGIIARAIIYVNTWFIDQRQSEGGREGVLRFEAFSIDNDGYTDLIADRRVEARAGSFPFLRNIESCSDTAADSMVAKQREALVAILRRPTRATAYNDFSSVCDTIFRFRFESWDAESPSVKRISFLHIVDLSSCDAAVFTGERTGDANERFQAESHAALTRFVQEVASGQPGNRDKPLTFNLKGALGGSSLTYFLAAVDPERRGDAGMRTALFVGEATSIVTVPVISELPARDVEALRGQLKRKSEQLEELATQYGSSLSLVRSLEVQLAQSRAQLLQAGLSPVAQSSGAKAAVRGAASRQVAFGAAKRPNTAREQRKLMQRSASPDVRRTGGKSQAHGELLLGSATDWVDIGRVVSGGLSPHGSAPDQVVVGLEARVLDLEVELEDTRTALTKATADLVAAQERSAADGEREALLKRIERLESELREREIGGDIESARALARQAVAQLDEERAALLREQQAALEKQRAALEVAYSGELAELRARHGEEQQQARMRLACVLESAGQKQAAALDEQKSALDHAHAETQAQLQAQLAAAERERGEMAQALADLRGKSAGGGRGVSFFGGLILGVLAAVVLVRVAGFF